MLALTAHGPFARLGLVLACAAPFAFILALPPFQYGIWPQTEPVLIALFVLSGLVAAWLAAGLYTGRISLYTPGPGLMCLLLFIGWQWVVTGFAVSPWRSWFGAGEIGIGAGWYTALSLYMLLVIALWGQGGARRTLLVSAALALAIQTALHAVFPASDGGVLQTGSWAPGEWPDYLPFMGAGLWLACVAGGLLESRRRIFAAAAAMLCLLAVSSNFTAQLVMPPLLLLAVIMRHHTPTRAVRLLAVIVCFAPLIWLGASAWLHPFAAIDSPDMVDTMLTETDGPVSSRIAFNQVGLAVLADAPQRLLYGGGWGAFTDDLFLRATALDGVTVWHDGVRMPNWFMVDGRTYHSHNQALEVLLSLGIAGLLLWLALPILVLARMPDSLFYRCAPMLCGVWCVYAFWFDIPQCLAFSALAFAPFLSPSHVVRSIHFQRPAAAIAAILAVVMSVSAALQAKATYYGEAMYDVLATQQFAPYPLAWMESDIARGGDRLRVTAMGFASTLEGKTDVSDAQAQWYAQYMLALHDAGLEPRMGARVTSAELLMAYKALSEIPADTLSPVRKQALASIQDMVLRLARQAPLRDDMATHLLFNLDEMTDGDMRAQQAFLEKILAAAPNHRPALWLLGKLIASQAGREEEGRGMMRRAAEAGVARVYPVTRSELEAVR